MTILETIQAALEAITPEQIAQAAQHLEPPEEGEVVFCVIESRHARALWALANHYEREDHLAEHARRFDATTPAERDTLKRAAVKASTLEDIARRLAWAEIQHEADLCDWSVPLGLRANYTLVKTAAPEREGISITALPISQDLLEVIMRRRSGGSGSEGDPPKGKPQ